MIFEPFPPFLSSAFTVKYATDPWERRGAAMLRREVFCEEQGVFERDDRDGIDAVATTIVALSSHVIASDAVVGTVRIHEAEKGVWWGSRLAVTPAYRRVGALGQALIRLAVSSAHGRGAKTFLAHVQPQNVTLFERMNWRALEEVELHGRQHFRMEADLAHYPPILNPEVGFAAFARRAA